MRFSQVAFLLKTGREHLVSMDDLKIYNEDLDRLSSKSSVRSREDIDIFTGETLSKCTLSLSEINEQVTRFMIKV